MAYLGEEIGKLGFGLMRLPHKEDGTGDIEQVCEMVDAYLEAGFTYFDTAFIYGDSEDIIRQALVERYPRESYQLATKAISWLGPKNAEEARGHFYTSLERTGAGYFDYYLLHMTGCGREQVFEAYDMWTFVKEKKAEGYIKHIGFSHHGSAESLDAILTAHPEVEFVQLQVNYLDWEHPVHQSRLCMEVAAKHNVPVIIMEPLRGGLLATPPATVEAVFKAAEPELPCAAWGLRYCASLPNVITVLSGMSTIEQMRENVAFMKKRATLTEADQAVVERALEEFGKFDIVPCTGCNYCTKACPEGIGISGSFMALNANILFGRHVQEWLAWGGGGKTPSHCIQCGACEEACPQGIAIVEELERAAEILG